ncbi:MAG TPA: prolipoprotein diacylglyceryl transferase [Candidatus Pullichristensenella stercorigallinarum]|uniref:Prolipoprotein diacylglyceryl transferase n=1 Tax=Candidatus Pullichristensenella stercorigallinarum TaxID=2840909 RepID=A0A9D0ZMG0_9FIRM|nr:prolipoprotein diacylglyceryl transferase [Candidatus Pullichristensenella stercorigallinarum]
MYPYITVFGFQVGTYGLWMLAGLFAAFFLFKHLFRRRGICWECALVIVCCAFGLALLGGYVFYMLFSVGLPAIVEAAHEGRLLETLSQGGIVFYGGLFSGILGVWIGCRIVGLRFLPVLDLCAPALALGHAFGRVGCLFAGCCYGMPCDLPFCFALSPYIEGGARLFPVQLFESACDLILCAALVLYLRKRRPVPRAAGIFLMSYATYRFIFEFFRGDEIRGRILGLSTSQFWSLPTFAAGAILCFIVARMGVNSDPFRTDEGRIRPPETEK